MYYSIPGRLFPCLGPVHRDRWAVSTWDGTLWTFERIELTREPAWVGDGGWMRLRGVQSLESPHGNRGRLADCIAHESFHDGSPVTATAWTACLYT